MRSLDALQKETQGIKDTTQQKDEQIDQLKHRVFELQSSVIQKKMAEFGTKFDIILKPSKMSFRFMKIILMLCGGSMFGMVDGTECEVSRNLF